MAAPDKAGHRMAAPAILVRRAAAVRLIKNEGRDQAMIAANLSPPDTKALKLITLKATLLANAAVIQMNNFN